jgi:hypothetical protein
MMRKLAILTAAAALLGAPGAMADPGADDGPTVVELFTSQSCYSCPPAEAFLGELAQRPDLVALEFHVDYWDDLVYGSAGKWKDVFSSPDNTDRQRRYNLSIRSSRQIYTPQMVIDGRYEAVGSRRSEVKAAIEQAMQTEAPRLSVTVAPAADGGFAVDVAGGVADKAGIWLARFRRAEETEVQRGENKGKTLRNHHVVTALERVGEWSGAAQQLALPPIDVGGGEGCAVLVQTSAPGPILGAALCPTPGA